MTPQKTKILLALVSVWLIVSACSSGEIPAEESVSAALMDEDLLQVSIQKLI